MPKNAPLDPLVTELRSQACRPLLNRMIKKQSRGGLLEGKIRLAGLDSAERATIIAVTGCSARGATLTIDLKAFDQVVRNTGRFRSLADLIEQATGRSFARERSIREQQKTAWGRLWDEAQQRVAGDPALVSCLQSVRRQGWLTRAVRRDPDAARTLLARAIDLLERLPVPPMPLAIFAARNLDDAHALDPQRPLSRLLVRLIAAREQLPLPTKTTLRRRTWESVGLVSDELSSTVLALNLPATGNGLTDAMLRQHARQGMPVRISFRHLRIHPITFGSPGSARSDSEAKRELYVCENPSVVAAACDALGVDCPPLVCVEGNPSLACLHLIEGWVRAGHRIAYHGDFDWGGLRIANRLYRQFHFRPWRYSAADYNPQGLAHRKLKPPPAKALWDEALSVRIKSAGVAVEEESVIQELIEDLARAGRSAAP